MYICARKCTEIKISIMRTVEFRAIKLNSNIWVYGNYRFDGVDNIHQIENWYYSKPEPETGHSDLINEWVDIVPETLGQFTGVYDKNNRKIFENDVVLQLTNNSKRPYKVEFNYGCFYAGFHNGSSTRERPKLLSKRVEIIGNTYDNPELLK